MKQEEKAIAKAFQEEREAELRRLLTTGDKIGPPTLRVIRGGK